MKRFLRPVLASYLVIAMFVIGIAPRVDAGFSPSELLLGQSTRASDMGHIQSFLEQKVVADRFAQLGFSPDEVQTRLAALDNEQLHKIALKVDQVKVGGELGVVIAVLVIIVLVLVIFRLVHIR